MDVRVRSYREKMKLNCLACMDTSCQLFHLHGLGGCACKPPDITSHLLQTARLAACVRFLVIAASGSGERALNKNLGFLCTNVGRTRKNSRKRCQESITNPRKKTEQHRQINQAIDQTGQIWHRFLLLLFLLLGQRKRRQEMCLYLAIGR